jgi:hypothetical protein
MDTGFKLLEGLRLSLYEVLAILVPGFSGMVLLRLYVSDVKFDAITGVPEWLLLFGGAIVSGHVLKGMVDLASQVSVLKALFPSPEGYSKMFVFDQVTELKKTSSLTVKLGNWLLEQSPRQTWKSVIALMPMPTCSPQS